MGGSSTVKHLAVAITRSKPDQRNGELQKLFYEVFGIDLAYDKINAKHFKRFYNGKPTKKYLKCLEQIKRSNRYTLEDMDRLERTGEL